MQNNIADFIAISNNTLLLTALLFLIIRLVNKSQQYGCYIITILILLFIVLVPIYHGFTLAQVARGIVGDLSITGLIMQCAIWVNYIRNSKSNVYYKIPCKVDFFNDILSHKFCIIIFILGLVLYLTTFNFIPFDLYAWGFYPTYLLVLIFILELIFWQINKIFAFIWLVALAAFYYKLQVSINLWDYLLDPILWLICTFKLLSNLFIQLNCLDLHIYNLNREQQQDR